MSAQLTEQNGNGTSGMDWRGCRRKLTAPQKLSRRRGLRLRGLDRQLLPVQARLSPTSASKWKLGKSIGKLQLSPTRLEHYTGSIPAAVRNTRRSISDTPYLPLTLVAPPPELHHFAKTGIAAGRPAADVVRRGARTPARARAKEAPCRVDCDRDRGGSGTR